MKKQLAVAGIIALTLTLSACSGGDEQPDPKRSAMESTESTSPVSETPDVTVEGEVGPSEEADAAWAAASLPAPVGIDPVGVAVEGETIFTTTVESFDEVRPWIDEVVANGWTLTDETATDGISGFALEKDGMTLIVSEAQSADGASMAVYSLS